ncbi:MAG: hypothetical protein IT445_13820 [Phycisphaeraceae bacterium]|nr:hypothetical protein [Phycisphaeraceae bacterium]
MNNRFVLVRILMTLAGIYDGTLGVAFVFFTARTFDLIQMPLPDHLGYVQFAAALLIVFALMFFAVAANPVRYLEFVTAGMGLKVSYIAVVTYYGQTQGVPPVWLWFAAADGLWLLLFIVIRAAIPRAVAVRPHVPV